jgi:hypothetical protein
LVKIQGYVTAKVVRGWLENYHVLAAGDKPLDAVPANSGPRPYDGVTGTQLNKIMLDMAIQALPPHLKACVYARWIRKWPLRKSLASLGLIKETYYNRCDQAVAFIQKHINGRAVGVKALAEKILSNDVEKC